MDVEGERTEGVAFRVRARPRVDAKGLSRYGTPIDATPPDGTDLQHVGIEGGIDLATSKGSRSRTRLFDRSAIDRNRIYWRQISNATTLRLCGLTLVFYSRRFCPLSGPEFGRTLIGPGAF